jgi:hypothetical protein
VKMFTEWQKPTRRSRTSVSNKGYTYLIFSRKGGFIAAFFRF